MNKKKRIFRFRGVISLVATDIDDAFRKLGKYYSLLGAEKEEDRDKADEFDFMDFPTSVKGGTASVKEVIEDLEEIIGRLKEFLKTH